MSTQAPAPDAPAPQAPVGRRRALNSTLALRPRGLWLVISLELRQRIRSKRWYIALAGWTVVLLGIGALGMAPTLFTAQWGDVEPAAAMIFSLQIILVLFAMLLVVPALSAGSINGDRTAGTLATLQASLLSPLEIVLGKLLAGFATGMAFLVLALPSVIPIAVLGRIGPLYLLRIVVVIVLLTLCVTAVGLGLSAITNRQLGVGGAGLRGGVRGDRGAAVRLGQLSVLPPVRARGDDVPHQLLRRGGQPRAVRGDHPHRDHLSSRSEHAADVGQPGGAAGRDRSADDRNLLGRGRGERGRAADAEVGHEAHRDHRASCAQQLL